MEIKVDLSALEKSFKNIKKQLRNKYSGVKIGYYESKAYSNGLEIVENVLLQNNGGVIAIPGREQNLYKSINEKTGSFNRNGKFVKKAKANFLTSVKVKNHIITMPPRPFLLNAMADEDAWKRIFLREINKTNGNITNTLKVVGNCIKSSIVKAIDDMKDPPNSPSTINKKKSDKPLIDTGMMRNSIQVSLIEKNN